MPKIATPKAAKPNARGIKADEVYLTESFCEGMGWGRKAFVSARKRGLPVHKESRRLYIIGSEAIEWMKSRGAAQ
jgi:hypothetical protein